MRRSKSCALSSDLDRVVEPGGLIRLLEYVRPKAMSRIGPQFMFRQMAKMAKPKK